MPSNIKEFDLDLKHFAETLVPKQHEELVQKIAFETLQRIVVKTPVDSGRARGNWLVAVDSVPQGVVEIDKLSKDAAVQLAMDNGVPVIESYRGFKAISLANNLPYIGVLELGSSKQAPKGMVSITLAEIREMFT